MSVATRFVALALAVLLPAVGHAQALKLAVSRGPVSLPIYMAEAIGAFKAEGLAVELVDCHSGRQCFGELEVGTADVATAAELVTVIASFRRADLALIATISASSQQIKLIARRSAGVEEPAQLAGKRVGTVGGTSAEFFLDRWLGFNGMDAKDVQRVALKPDELLGALAGRQIDAVAIWEPIAASARAELGADALPLPSARVYTQHFGLTTTRTALQQRGTDLQRLLRALLRAQQAIGAQPAQAKALLRQRLGVSEAAADALLAEHDYRVRLDQSLVSTMEGQARWLVRERLVEGGSKPANLLRLVEAAPLRAVAPAAVGLVP